MRTHASLGAEPPEGSWRESIFQKAKTRKPPALSCSPGWQKAPAWDPHKARGSLTHLVHPGRCGVQSALPGPGAARGFRQWVSEREREGRRGGGSQGWDPKGLQHWPHLGTSWILSQISVDDGHLKTTQMVYLYTTRWVSADKGECWMTDCRRPGIQDHGQHLDALEALSTRHHWPHPMPSSWPVLHPQLLWLSADSSLWICPSPEIALVRELSKTAWEVTTHLHTPHPNQGTNDWLTWGTTTCVPSLRTLCFWNGSGSSPISVLLLPGEELCSRCYFWWKFSPLGRLWP